MRSTAEFSTVTERERDVGVIGPAPLDEHIEIRWARMGTRDVVIKAAGHPHRSRLRREAEVLQRIAGHEGFTAPVVGFVELVDGADHTELVTIRHGTVTLAEVGLLSPSERTDALLSLCEALDGLHAAGWAHGSIEAAHVLVDPGSQDGAGKSDAGPCGVRLCSLGDAEQLGGSMTGASRSADLEAMGTVILDALEAPGGFGTRRERHRYQSAANKAHKRLSAARGLHDGAGTARILRETIGRRIRPGTSNNNRQSAGRRSSGRSNRWSTWLVAAAAAACIVAGSATARALHESKPTPPPCAVAVAGNRHSCGGVAVEGNVVTIAGQSFELGSPRDEVLVGDWDCDGTATALLLESSTGGLFHFGTWSMGSEELAGEQIGTFEGATGLRSGSPCQYPEVELADGSAITPLEPSRAAQDGNG